MLRIYLDTALLAVPNYGYGSSSACVQELIDRVTHYSIVLSEDIPLQLIVADDVEGALGVDFPTPQSIKEFLDEVGLAHIYSVNDLLQQYLTILSRAARPRDLGTFEVHEASKFCAVPPLPPGLGPATLLSESERVFTTVAAQVADGAWWLGSAMIGTARQKFQISATVDVASHDLSPIDGKIPFALTRSVKTLENIVDIIDFAHAEEIWKNSQSEDDLYLAIYIGAISLLRTAKPDASCAGLRSFSIGCGFPSSLTEHNCSGTQRYSSTTFELCAQIVADNGTASVGTMGRPHQRTRERDGAKACRTHITGGGLALRLMHWETSTGIEFANVGVKQALYIDPGDAALKKRTLDLTIIA